VGGGVGSAYEMTPVLASDFGNVFVLGIGVPATVISCVLGAVALVLRFRPLAISCGVVCFVVASCFFVTLGAARQEEFVFTIVWATFSLLAAVGLVFLERKPKKESSSD
jgi:Na+-transporting NADH:ubiquinone oxidoreductase subunit NqrB